MPYINRLKNGVGEKDFACFTPKNIRVLVLPRELKIADEMIPESIRNSESGIQLHYRPQVFTLRADENGMPALYDISNQKQQKPEALQQELPQAFFQPPTKFVFNGYMLCIDNKLAEAITSSADSEFRKQAFLQIKGYENLFKIKNSEEGKYNFVHELQHWQNDTILEAIKQENREKKLPEMQLTPKQRANVALADELSATTKDFLTRVVDYLESGESSVFGERFDIVTQDLAKRTAEERTKLLNNPEYLLKQSIASWYSLPRNQKYFDTDGDIAMVMKKYAKNIKPMDINSQNKQYQKIVEGFFNFNIKGKQINLSAHLPKDFGAPEILYKEIDNDLNQQKKRVIDMSVRNKRSA